MNSTSQAQDITSKTFHGVQWSLLLFGIIGNSLVTCWRCSSMRQSESNRRLISALIICLALADLMFSCQSLLKEVTVFNAVFGRRTNTSDFRLDDLDFRLCFASSFLEFVSVASAMFTVVAIALHTYVSISRHRYGSWVVISVLLTGWLLSFTLAALTIDNLNRHHFSSLLDGSPQTFTLIVYLFYGNPHFPFIILFTNGIASVACSVLYILALLKLRKIRRMVRRQLHNENSLGALQIRMIIIVFLNIVCWWPPCILYSLSYLTGDSLRNGRMDGRLGQFGFAVLAASSAVNPVIYTLSWKTFRRIVNCVCFCLGRRCNSGKDHSDVSGKNEGLNCCIKWKRKDPITSWSDDTQSTSAFDSNYQLLAD
jgi:hypothetical protein